MSTVTKRNATAPLADYVDGLDAGPVIVTSNGRPVAALISLRGVDLDSASLGLNPKFMAMIERSRRGYEREGGLTLDEMKARYGTEMPRPRKGARRSPRSRMPKGRP